MERRKHIKLFATMLFAFVLLSALSGCNDRKKFDSPEAMISELSGTYSGTIMHSEERIIIGNNCIIKFNVDDIFPKITDDDFFWKNFPKENWETFDIDVLLSKPYIKITTEPISANFKEGSISGMWVNKDGELFSEEGYPLTKLSSDFSYPTAEMQKKFEEYRNYLQEHEISIIIDEAKDNFSKNQESLKSALSSATSPSPSMKSTATAETIAECAFESIKDALKYPRTASLDGYSRSPQYDSYGRVCTLISVTAQNSFGNYITDDWYVVLQSCSYSGKYTYKTSGLHYAKEKNSLDFLMFVNDWNKDPSTDSTKEEPYNKAIQLIKDKEYWLAANKLGALGNYKSSAKLKEACVRFFIAEKYKQGIDLFSKGKYTEASEELSTLLKDYSSGYLRAERVIALCEAAINNTSDDSNTTSGDGNTSQPPETQPPETQPPETQPPTTQPPETQPPETQPPETQPPETQPPTTQPPATQPPATQPPETQPTECSHNYADASCTTPQTCTKCGQTKGTVLEHTYSEATCSAPKTCTKCGTTSGSVADHKWNDASCTAPQTCSQCGKTLGSALNHTYANATCTAPQTCTVCGKTNGSALGHSFGDATCTTAATCNTCGATASSPAGHQWKDITETVHHEEQGHYEDVQNAIKAENYRCPRCGYNADTYETKDAYYAHFDSAHGDELNSSFDRDRYEMVEGWVYETETVWVVDKEAYTETVIIGKECTVCGTTE